MLVKKMISESEVKKILSTILDPELGHNIVDLGLIYKINVESDKIIILMTLTTPGCPLSGYFHHTIQTQVAAATGLDPDQVEINLTFDPPWSPEAMSEELRLELGI
ncbi:MAG TPA: iron-sulfur cluster assembly protein [Anaerolineales bacterium]|nr:iron-sulfur cluster assembly protein [Anaerolineales bacterium]